MKGFATMGSHQCGVEGAAVEMPTLSREIELVYGNASASRRPLRFYFSFEKILAEVIKARLSGRGAYELLPPRRYWSRPSAHERNAETGERSRISSRTTRRMAIRRRVMKCRKDGTLEAQPWGRALVDFVTHVQRTVFSGAVAFESPRLIKIAKGYTKGCKTFREVASFERLEDRVIQNLATMCLRDWLETQLSRNCYSFRRDGRITHEDAVVGLQAWRARHADGPMYVAECDIKSFFDSISHAVVRRCWLKSAQTQGSRILEGVLEAYLQSYSARGTMGRGLPQGGSLSIVLANLVLSEADACVLRQADGDLFYARYCDDVVFAHPDRARCQMAMLAYETALRALELPMHPVEAFTYREGARYYEIKSKGPFLWGEPFVSDTNVAPWVSFLGSQIKYDGEIRIRRESITRHERSLGRVTAEAVREVASGHVVRLGPKEVCAWFQRFRNRLIAKGVGYVTAKFQDCIGCWAGAFTAVTMCEETQSQMKYLDRVRERMLNKVYRLVVQKMGKKQRRFKGRPYSYHAFLMKEVERPTNMMRRSQSVRLRYSEI